MKVLAVIKTNSKAIAVLSILFILMLLLPVKPIEPWNLISLRKIATMIFALTLIQVLGSALTQVIVAKLGVIATGFFCGFVSSTATTASIARKSKISSSPSAGIETLTLLSATSAMLIEGLIILIVGTRNFHFSMLAIFLAPLFLTFVLILTQSRKIKSSSFQVEPEEFKLIPILKLSIFIILILAASKFLQNQFGQYSLPVLTFLVSLFEIHSSVIANVQLFESGAFTTKFLSSLISLSILASYLSKLFLVFSLGSQSLKRNSLQLTLPLIFSLVLSWTYFMLTS